MGVRANQRKVYNFNTNKETLEAMKKDSIKVIAYTLTYGIGLNPLVNIDQGKNNLASYFVDKKCWSFSKLQRILNFLVRERIMTKEVNRITVDAGGCYTLVYSKPAIKRILWAVFDQSFEKP